MGYYKKCIWISSAFLLIGVALIIFSVFIFKSLIQMAATDSALMNNETYSLWGEVPGDSNVALYKDHFFYNISNLEDAFYHNSKIKAEEKGIYRVQEYDNFTNVAFSDDNSTVSFKLWRYFKNPNETEAKNQEDLITNLNVVSLGVWYGAKHATQSQVALKALYTIWQTFSKDMMYSVHQEALKNGAIWKSFIGKGNNYFSPEKKKAIEDDPEYGIKGNNNAVFFKSVESHPSQESLFIRNYFGLTFNEMEILKRTILSNATSASDANEGVRFGAEQWLTLEKNKHDTVAKQNKTAPGYIEYGAYLKYMEPNYPKSKLTMDKTLKLMFTFNDFNTTAPRIDDSHSIINKKNLDDLFDIKTEKERIEFVNKQFEINDITESKYLYNYINYVSSELAFNLTGGGTAGTGAISDFLSQALRDVIISIGWDSYFSLLSHYIKQNVFTKSSCQDNLNTFFSKNVDKICSEKKFSMELENMPFWINGILYGEEEFKTLLIKSFGFTKFEYNNLVLSEDGELFKAFKTEAWKIIDKWGLTQKPFGNHRGLNIYKLAMAQWFNSEVTKEISPQLESVKDTFYGKNHYKKAPELGVFGKKFDISKITKAMVEEVVNYDNLFAANWISNCFIGYKKKTGNPFHSKPFLDYLRYIFANEVLDLFTTKTVKDLLWGYQDPLLVTVNNTNPFLGGDPTVFFKGNFSFLNNMTSADGGWMNQDLWEFNTGVKNPWLTRQYTRASNYSNFVWMNEQYFDGEKFSMKSRNPWKDNVTLNGTDALSFNPGMNKSSTPWIFLDDLYRTAAFVYNGTKTYNGLELWRYLLSDTAIQNKTMYPYNDVYYSDKYNGFGNMTSTTKAPLFASKPYYYQCDNMEKEMPEIIKLPRGDGKSNDPDDVRQFNESYADVEPLSGAVVRAGQKLLISALLEPDELFDIEPKFVPIYLLVRSGNYSQDSVNHIFGDLITGFSIQVVMQIVGIALTFLCISLIVFSIVRIQQKKYGWDKTGIKSVRESFARFIEEKEDVKVFIDE
jgi:hypothetical protein